MSEAIRYGIFSGYRDSYVVWFRFFGYGLSFKRTQLTFSERNGYKKYIPLPFGWRIIGLKP